MASKTNASSPAEGETIAMFSKRFRVKLTALDDYSRLAVSRSWRKVPARSQEAPFRKSDEAQIFQQLRKLAQENMLDGRRHVKW